MKKDDLNNEQNNGTQPEWLTKSMEINRELITQVTETKKLIDELKLLILERKYRFQLYTEWQIAQRLDTSRHHVRNKVLDEIEKLAPGSVIYANRRYYVKCSGFEMYKNQYKPDGDEVIETINGYREPALIPEDGL